MLVPLFHGQESVVGEVIFFRTRAERAISAVAVM